MLGYYKKRKEEVLRYLYVHDKNLILQAYFGIIMALGMQLYRQELYFKNCKPAMIQSRKRESKIHANETVSNVKRFATRVADFIDEGLQIPTSRIALAA